MENFVTPLPEKTPSICLNMIVKNESKVILRMLKSVLPIIDSYCICDTGSTDDTIEIIENFFKVHNIEGRIIQEPFRDFGYNRTFALNACVGLPKSDFLLLMDADMVLRIGTNIDKYAVHKLLTADAHHIFQGTDSFYYKNVRILRNDPNYSYWGVTHEYVKTTPNSRYVEIDRNVLFIDDIGDGGAKQDKFERDIRLLLKGLEENPDNDRYTFYLANSYMNTRQYEKAIEYYKKRIVLGGWNQEVWFSYYSIGKCYKSLGDIPNALHYWIEAYQYFPERIENLYQLVNYYRMEGKNVLANAFYELADYERNNNKTDDYLFLEKDIYEYKLDYEFSILAYYRNPFNRDIRDFCMKVLSHPCSEETINRNVLSNYKFYVKPLQLFCENSEIVMSRHKILQSIGPSTMSKESDKDNYVSSTPSLYMDSYNKKLYVNVRYVTYRIDENGGYSYDERICTKNVIGVVDMQSSIGSKNGWIKEKEFLLDYNTCYDGLYVGLEDIRLFSDYESLLFNANRGLGTNKMVIETGKINMKLGATSSHLIYLSEGQRDIEKNWVMFKDKEKQTKMIYGWSPLKIGVVEDPRKIDDKSQITMQLNIVFEGKTPNFFRWVRGSTNGVTIDNEIWFICHIVSYEDRRHYYHLFVVLDLDTMQVKRYSKLFNFAGEKVEYTLGFVYLKEEKQFIIGYSIMDRETHYMSLSRENVENIGFISCG